MFKKHTLALVLGAMVAAPAAFADDQSTEGVIYQADQTGSLASINQIANETPQAAAIMQIDVDGAILDGGPGLNNAVIMQGATTGNGGVTIEEDGSTASNIAIEDFADYGVAAPVVSVLADYADQLTGGTPTQYLLQGQTSDNYAVVVQNGQGLSQAAVFQANDETLEALIPQQNSLFNDTLEANAQDGVATADGTTVNGYLYDTNRDTSVAITYTGGEVGIADSLGNEFVVGEGLYAPFTEAEGNIAFVTQGAPLTFSKLNSEEFSTEDLADANAEAETLNRALVIQGGVNSYARIGQHGNNNSSGIVQLTGDDGENVAESYQYTDENGLVSDVPVGNFSLIAQAGDFNLAQTYQTGENNTSYVYQYGVGNISTVDQNAIGAVAFVYQSSAGDGGVATGNIASVYQYAAQ